MQMLKDRIMREGRVLPGSIIKVDAYNRIAGHTDEYIYFRTDHHWTALGAYYAYLAFAEAAGFVPITIDNYIEHSIMDFIGSLGRGMQQRTVTDYPDTIYYYELNNGITFSRKFFRIPEDLSKANYRIFMGGDYAKLDYTTSNENGRTLVVVKDSYANALIPWISPHYQRIVVIDPRQYEGSVTQLLKELKQPDILFVNYTAATGMADFVEMIRGRI